jgi:hypothetical protein
MPDKQAIEAALKRVADQQSFFNVLLAETLAWPTRDVQQIEEIAYGWSSDDLKAANLDKDLLDGSIWQIQPAERGQPWGIFVLEFKRPDLLSPHRGMAGVLRTVLRGLIGSRRKEARLPSWKREHLLFICTCGWRSFRFAYFRAKPDDPRASRLTTFGWGPETSNRTVCEFNLPALAWPDDPSDTLRWVEDWTQAFDKEPLTKDFFKRFDHSLEAIKADLEKFQNLNSAEAYTQAQLLLERLIFLYFLQNRGWLDQDRHYLRARLTEHQSNPSGFTYYGQFLDRLFWTLASGPGEPGRLPGIPYLNGGLFDDDEFRQPAELRKANPPLKVSNATFGVVFGDLLESFNFTVTEDTPLNQEVAVDPEMLGKVFESIVLHAEAADPDAVAPDKRKATGSYYTPRIVVHFICREVLYQYLHARLQGEEWSTRLRTLLDMDASDGLDDEARDRLKRSITPEQAVKLRDLVEPLKCCDPAVGSGAFPVGLLHELVNLRRLLTTAANGYADPVRREGPSWLHDTKAQIVQNCLFGVDIQQQAIEICRLRLWLTLVVDYDIGLEPFLAERGQFSTAIDRISQLPNLEMNFHRGDSLHDHICGVPIVILPNRASRYAPEFQGISKLGQELHKAKRAERKRNLRLNILEKRLTLSRRILDDELRALRTQDSALDNLFGLAESAAKKRERLTREIGQIERALKKVGDDQQELERLKNRIYDKQFYPKLRKLEGADFDSPFNFAWTIDFPGIYGPGTNGGGFDIIVGNPPFVTARNPKKRELWRERWPRVCTGTYQLVCPFMELGFDLLRHGGQLGYIVSNAFARREFGRPLVEDFLPTVGTQKVVDCSGLMFPGHGTPTCLVFGGSHNPSTAPSILVTAILPGGGDLRTPPEDSVLWHSIAANHDRPEYEDARISVHDWNTAEFLHWPLNFDFKAHRIRLALEEANPTRLEEHLEDTIGRVCFTGADEIYFVPPDLARRLGIEMAALSRFVVGDGLRDWTHFETHCICPYDHRGALIEESLVPRLLEYLSAWRGFLGARLSYGETQERRGLAWWEYSIAFPERIKGRLAVSLTEIATHNHAAVIPKPFIANRANPLAEIKEPKQPAAYHLLAAILNGPVALFWLKQVCFSKREAEEAQTGTYFEFAGGKVQQLPLPKSVAWGSFGKDSGPAALLSRLSRACSERGQKAPQLAMRVLFEKLGEAYQQWNSNLAGYVAPDPELGPPFESAESLWEAYKRAQDSRERLRAEMVALQEEMDWLLYAGYGLLLDNDPAVVPGISSLSSLGDNGSISVPLPLDQADRPFRLWEKAGGDYSRAASLIPAGWPAERRALWNARLAAIRDDEHIRRIEQPVYKRRWDEQWKVGNEWRCGQVAYAAEFVDAFEWWLREKAEWWLEHKKNGGPVELDDWVAALWKDPRVQAAWPVTAEQAAFLEHEKAREKAETEGDEAPAQAKPDADLAGFAKAFKRIIDDETVPEGLPWAIPFNESENKQKTKVPARVKSIRGNLNVPRERFHLRGKTTYLWAGLQFG